MCVGGNCGVEVSEKEENVFKETTGCFILEVENDQMASELLKGIPFKILGKTIKEEKIKVSRLFSAELNKLKAVWQKPMKEYFS